MTIFPAEQQALRPLQLAWLSSALSELQQLARLRERTGPEQQQAQLQPEQRRLQLERKVPRSPLLVPLASLRPLSYWFSSIQP